MPVPGGVNLLAVGQGKGVVTGHRLPGFGKGDAIARLEGLDFNAHFDKFKLDQKITKSLINHRRRMISTTQLNAKLGLRMAEDNESGLR